MRVIPLARAWVVLLSLSQLASPALAQSTSPQGSAQSSSTRPEGRSSAPSSTRTGQRPNAVSARSHEADPDTPDLPVSLDRIREALERAPQPVITLPQQPSFSIVIEGELPQFEDFVQPGELQTFALPNAMSHQEFLSMVTPSEYRSFSSFTSGELAQVVATGVAGSLALSAVTKALKEGWRARRERSARDEVDAVLEALRERDEAAAAGDASRPPSDPPPE